MKKTIKFEKGWFHNFPLKVQTALLKLTLSAGCVQPFIKNGNWIPYIVIAIHKKTPVGWCIFFSKKEMKKINFTASQVHFYIHKNWRKQGIARLLGQRMIKYIKQYRSKEAVRVMPHDESSEIFFNWFVKEAKSKGVKILSGWGDDSCKYLDLIYP